MTTTNENEATNANANEEREQDGDVRQEESEATGTPESVEDTAATDQQVSLEELQADLATRDERVSALEEQVISLERELSSTVSRYRLRCWMPRRRCRAISSVGSRRKSLRPHSQRRRASSSRCVPDCWRAWNPLAGAPTPPMTVMRWAGH